MLFAGAFILSAVWQVALAAQFKVIAPGGTDVQVSVNGINTKLSAPDADVPYFVGEVDALDNSQYKYIVDGKQEDFQRILSGGSTKNDIFLRPVTYANIPELPNAIGTGDWQNAITPGPIWDINYIPSVFVKADPKDVTSLVKKLSKNVYKAKITIIDADSVHTYEGADFQLHKPGKTHNNAKQSWRWKLPEKLNGRHEFKIRHMEEDPTQIREKLYADVLRAMGVYAPQANMIRFFINGEGYGTFNMLDDIPTYSYIEAVLYGGNLPASKGPLFDGSTGASFEDTPDMPNSFQPAEGSSDNKTMIVSVAKKLKALDPADDNAVAEFARSFQVDQFLRFMVMEYLAGHWDGYWMGQTNLGAYEDIINNMLYFLDQDFDGTFGVNFNFERSFVEEPYTVYPDKFPEAVMINKLLKNPKITDTFTSYLKSTVTNVFNDKTLTARVTSYHEFILRDLKWDRSIKQKSKGINYEWSFADVTDNLHKGVSGTKGGGASWGLIEYIQVKSAAVAKQYGL